jgi:hypothetical protein
VWVGEYLEGMIYVGSIKKRGDKGQLEAQNGSRARSVLGHFIYLAIFFGVFTWYRRFVLAEYRITYLHYGTAIIEALILAK